MKEEITVETKHYIRVPTNVQVTIDGQQVDIMDGYYYQGKSYVMDPHRLFKVLGYKSQETPIVVGHTIVNNSYQITHSELGLPSLNIKKCSYLNYTLNNLALGDVQSKVGEQIGSELSWDEGSKTASFTVANKAAGDVFSNLEKDSILGLGESKKKTLVGIGRSMFNQGYELAFIAGMLANLKHEGQSAGFFESSNYASAPSSEPDYLQYMDKNHDYRNKYSGQSVVGKSLSELSSLLDKLDSSKRQGFGLGSVQWTFGRTETLVKVYQEVTASNDTITFEQAIEAEALLIHRELDGYHNEDYADIYPNWKVANSGNLNSEQAAYNAGVNICKKYERPAHDSSATRGNTAKEVYKIMMPK